MFFRRARVDSRVWYTMVAPLLGVASPLTLLYFALSSVDVLLGVKGPLQNLFLAALFGSLAFGIGFAYFLKARRPHVYAALAETLDQREG